MPKYYNFSKVRVLIVFLFFICSSCGIKENPCNLTFLEAPEIRGFRLGMTYDEVKQKLNSDCVLKEHSFNFDKEVSESYRKSILSLRKYRIFVKNIELENSVKHDLNGKPTICGSEGTEILFDPQTIKELEGIDTLTFFFDEDKRMSRIFVDYSSKVGEDSFVELKKSLNTNLKDSLNLSAYTNWETNKDELYSETLYCKNLVISSNIFPGPGFGSYEVFLSIGRVTDEELMEIQKEKLEKTKKQEEEKEKIDNEKKLKEEKDKKDSEVFKP